MRIKANAISAVKYVMVLLIILASGSAWGWSIPNFSYILLLVCLICWLLRARRPVLLKENVIRFLIYSVVYMVTCVFNGEQIGNIGFYVMLLTLLLAAEAVSRKNYEDMYIFWMTVLGGGSLFFWVLAQFGRTPGAINVVAENGKAYLMNLFYIYRGTDTGQVFYGINRRNQGVFWEPGAFQGYLNVALLLFLMKDENRAKNFRYWFTLAILLAAIFSTQSTTGYFTVLLIIIAKVCDHYKNGMKKRHVVLILAVIVAGAVILNSSVVTDKFSDSNISFALRFNDNINGLKACFISPIYGLGYGTARYTNVLKNFGIIANSTGILAAIQMLGFFFGIIWLLLIWNGIRQSIRTTGLSTVLFYFVMIVLFSGEVFNTRHVFLIYMYSFYEDLNSIGMRESRYARGNIG